MPKSLPATLKAAPFFTATFPFVAGMSAAHLIGPRAWAVPLYGALLLICVLLNLLYISRKQSGGQQISFLSFSLMLLLSGAVLMSLSESASQPRWPDKALTWRGFVVDSRDAERTVRCRVRLCSHAVGRTWISDGEDVQVSLLKDTLTDSKILPGDALLFYGRMTVPLPSGNPDAFDYAEWLRHQNIGGTCTAYRNWELMDKVEAERLLGMQPLPTRWLIRLMQWRTGCVNRYSDFPLSKRDRGVLSALTLGSRYELSRPVRRLYAVAGGSHVLALSGLHLGILVMILLTVMKPLRRTRRGRMLSRLISLLFVWGFVFLTGAPLSLLRSALMYSMLALFLLQSRTPNALNSLSVAAFILLVISPQSLLDISFQLSFISVLAIIVLYPFYKPYRPQSAWAGFLADFLFMAVAAQTATAPLVAYNFNILPVYFLLTDFVAVPCAYVLLGGSVVFFLFYFVAPIRWLTAWILTFTVEAVNSGLEAIASLPSASIDVYPSVWLTLSIYVLMIAMSVCLLRRSPKTLFVTMIAAAMCVSVYVYDVRPGRVSPQLIFFDHYSCPAVQFIARADRSWVWSPSGDSLKVEAELSTVASRFWGRRRIKPRKHITESCSDLELKGTENVFRFLGLTVAMIDDDRWTRRHFIRPVSVDYMYVCRGFRGHLDELSFHSGVVVLSASLQERRRRELIEECIAVGQNCYDVAESGALQVRTDGNKNCEFVVKKR